MLPVLAIRHGCRDRLRFVVGEVAEERDEPDHGDIDHLPEGWRWHPLRPVIVSHARGYCGREMDDWEPYPEDIYALLTEDGRRSVRPGEVLQLYLRHRNAYAAPTPAVRARVLIPTGWTALDPLTATLPELAPGDAFAFAVRVRAEVADPRTERSRFQALLERDDAPVLATNIVTVRVVGRPVFDGPAGGISIHAGPTGKTLSARVTLVNEGDATARGLRLSVPAPAGFSALEPPELPPLAPGERTTVEVLLTALAPACARVVIDDATVAFDGGADLLATREPFVPRARLVPERIVSQRRARRLDVTLHLQNDGWLPAVGERCVVRLPPGWEPLAGATLAAGVSVPAHADAEVLTVALPPVPSGPGLEVCLTATGAGEGTVEASCRDGTVTAELAGPPRRGVRLAAWASTGSTRAGDLVAILLALWNDGERRETLDVLLDGVPATRLEVGPGCVADAAATAAAPAGGAGLHDVAVEVRSHDGTPLAAATVAIRVWAPPLPEPEAADIPETPVDAEWVLPARGAEGAVLPLGLRLRCRSAVARLAVRVPGGGGLPPYVLGSTCVDGHPILDPPDAPVLATAEGLCLYDMPAGTRTLIAWAVLPRASAVAAVEVWADGFDVAPAPAEVAIDAAAPFAPRPASLGYHLGAAVAPPPAGTPTSPDPGTAPLPDAALLRIARGRCAGGVLGNLPILAALVPESCGPLREVHERLFVKLRIPGYWIGPADLEDPAARRALVAAGAPSEVGRLPLASARALAAAARLAPAPGIAGAYAAALATALEAAGGVAPADLPEHLAASDAPELERCRAALLAAS